jgi:hypothetical protein
VLTVIALCLMVLVFRPVFVVTEASADVVSEPVAVATPPPVAETPAKDPVLKVNIVEIGGWELLSRSALPVEIESGPVPVRFEHGPPACSCN